MESLGASGGVKQPGRSARVNLRRQKEIVGDDARYPLQ
jgi:hypothetical protein